MPTALRETPRKACDPQFVTEGEPVAALAQAVGCWHRSDGAPGVRGRVVGVLRSRRVAAAYHVDFSIQQHTRHVTLACRHRCLSCVRVSDRIVLPYLALRHKPGSVTSNHIHQPVEACRRHTRARCRQYRSLRPTVSYRVVDLHVVDRTAKVDAIESTRHIHLSTHRRRSALCVPNRDRRPRGPGSTIKALIGR